jgi:hypothetical protein
MNNSLDALIDTLNEKIKGLKPSHFILFIVLAPLWFPLLVFVQVSFIFFMFLLQNITFVSLAGFFYFVYKFAYLLD